MIIVKLAPIVIVVVGDAMTSRDGDAIEYDVTGFLCDHVDGGGRIGGDWRRHDGRVDNAQVRETLHPDNKTGALTV